MYFLNPPSKVNWRNQIQQFRLIPLLLFCLTFSLIQAQDAHTLDSLKNLISNEAADSTLCHAYLAWGEQLYLKDPDTSLILWQRTVEIAERNLAKDIQEKDKRNYLDPMGSAFNNIGYIYTNKGNIEKGLNYYHKALKVNEELGNTQGMAVAFSNIGSVHISQGDVEQGLEYFIEGLEMQKQIGDPKGVAITLSNIGYVYSSQGDARQGLIYFHKSLNILKEIGDQKGMASCLNNIASIHDTEGNIEKSLRFYTRSLDIRRSIEDLPGVAVSLNNVGGIYFDQGQVEIAKTYIQESLVMSRKLGNPNMISHTASLLSQIAKKEGNFKEALKMYELNILMRDSINNEETQKATIRQQTKYEFEKAALVKEQEERETERLDQETRSRRDNLQYSIVLIGLLGLGAGLLTLGRFSIPERVAEGLIFFTFLIFFEFILVMADPYVDNWTGGAPGWKLLINAAVAALIFPLHAFFETTIKRRLSS